MHRESSHDWPQPAPPPRPPPKTNHRPLCHHDDCSPAPHWSARSPSHVLASPDPVSERLVPRPCTPHRLQDWSPTAPHCTKATHVHSSQTRGSFTIAHPARCNCASRHRRLPTQVPHSSKHEGPCSHTPPLHKLPPPPVLPAQPPNGTHPACLRLPLPRMPNTCPSPTWSPLSGSSTAQVTSPAWPLSAPTSSPVAAEYTLTRRPHGASTSRPSDENAAGRWLMDPPPCSDMAAVRGDAPLSPLRVLLQ